ncbi:MAG: hypothetical protein NTW59_02225, partial [Candidatus Diapherotrites archaeon]|nr:hypothetical protein [Candidatus Diapherotrites archaeon]
LQRQPLVLPRNVPLLQASRYHTKVTPFIREIAKKFPGNDAPALQRIANFVFDSTQLKQTVWGRKDRYRRTAEDVLRSEEVDLLHCYDRSHALISILIAKGIPTWIVISVDFQNMVHSYVEAFLGDKPYTIAFRLFEPPIFGSGNCEKALGVPPGTIFLRGKELSDFGITSHSGFLRFVEQVNAGKVRDRIKFGWGQKK